MEPSGTLAVPLDRRLQRALVILNVIEAGGAVQALMTIPEFIWELSIGIYLIVKGYRTSSPALAGTQEAPLV
jgi:hypothetical protein